MIPTIPNLTETEKFGTLLTPDMKLYRKYFDELVKLQGIKVVYYAPKTDKHYTLHGELFSNYQEPEVIGCIFSEYPDSAFNLNYLINPHIISAKLYNHIVGIT